MKIERRDFVKLVGSGATVAAFSCRDQQEAERLSSELPVLDAEGVAWDKAPCRFCGVEVGVRDGKVLAVRGDEASPVNKGLLCVKGYHLPGFLYGEDRLTHPMCRAPVAEGDTDKLWLWTQYRF